jgi:hypothetical protein
MGEAGHRIFHKGLTLTLAIISCAPALAEAAKPISIGAADQANLSQIWAPDEMTTVNFIKGGSALTEAEALNLKALYEVSSRAGSIVKIQVIAWPDMDDLSFSQDKPRHAQVALAQKRIDTLTAFLNEMSQKLVETHNMASDKNAKKLSALLTSKGGPQRAVVIIERAKSPVTHAADR